jgi:cellulose synthase/poly-beta-1,6-N-acetylglucosamine synthase-like glycosyltransferase
MPERVDISMLDLLFIPIALIYLIVVGALFVYGINFFYLTYISFKKEPESGPLQRLNHLPAVTIQLPIYNELYVAERLVNAAASLDYPSHLLQIQVLDDSVDETTALIEQQIELYQRAGINIQHHHRSQRTGYKAGALAAGLGSATGEFIAIFDADFIPSADFLQKTLPAFREPKVAFVQTRWGHVNREYSLLTMLQSLAIDAHFMVEQYARYLAGYWFNFNGTAGVWRKEAILDAGGWTADTLTEDLDLSYRTFIKGWKAVYLRDVEVPAELPVSFNAYRRQQGRWARGSLECALKFLPLIWNSSLSLRHKLQASLHLTGYGVHLLLASLVILYPFILLLGQRYPSLTSLFGIGLFFNITAFSPTIFFVAAERQLGARWKSRLPVILFVSILGVGMMVNTLRATVNILLNKSSAFERTPKYGIVRRSQNWMANRYQLKLDPIVYWEFIFALINGLTVFLAIHARNWVIAAYACMFCAGLLFTSGTTLFQSLFVSRRQAGDLSVPDRRFG